MTTSRRKPNNISDHSEDRNDIFNAVAFLFGQGGAARTMIKLGSGQRDEAESIMGNSVISIIASGAVLTVVMYIFAEPIMYFLGASSASIDAAVTYMRIYTLGAVAIMGYMGFLQFVISQGATKQAMVFVVLGALLNVVWDPILIFGFNMGVAGAAISTVLSQLLIWENRSALILPLPANLVPYQLILLSNIYEDN